jgi:putative pyruvate formate lyase activating enzyme
VAALGRAVDAEEFARICLVLQERGAENINLVTGSHAIPALAEGILAARSQGLAVPVLWNSSAYESPGTLSLLEDLIDVYLPDLKTLDRDISRRFFNAADYPEHAEAAILRMIAARPTIRYAPARGTGPGEGQVLVSGVVIRHLALPGFLDATRQVLCWFAEHCRDRALLSLMTQYTPVRGDKAGPDRYINPEEYEAILGWLEELDIEDGFYQELSPDNQWLPDFNHINPFSSSLSLPVWHWKAGFV